MRLGGRLLAATAVVVAVSIGLSTSKATAITGTQVQAPVPVVTADPHQGAGDGVPIPDTKDPAEAAAGNNVVLLVAVLGVLVGVLIVTRSRRGPEG